MPRKRKRLKGFIIADCAKFGLKLTSVAADGVPVPGLKGAAGGASMLLDKFEARANNIDDEKQARARADSICDRLTQLSHGQLAQEEVESYRQRILSHLDQLPDLVRKTKFEQLVRADKYARAIADCNAALDRLQRDIELELGRKSLAISQAMQGYQKRQEDTLQGVVHSIKELDERLIAVQGSLVVALRQLPESKLDKPSGEDHCAPLFPINTPVVSFVLFSTQGSQVPGWN